MSDNEYEEQVDAADAILAMLSPLQVQVNALVKEHIANWAFKTPEDAYDHTRAELVAIGARIADWRNLNKRIEFLTMVAQRITFLSVLRNEGVTLTLVGDDKFTSEPKNIAQEIREWIVANRAAIVAELKAKKATP